VSHPPHGEFNASLHPRGPGGRFTRSLSRPATPQETKRGHDLMTRFSPAKGGGNPLAGMSGDKGTVDRFHNAYGPVNTALRAGGPSTPDITAIHSAMKPLPHDTLLHRQVPLAMFGKVRPGQMIGLVVRDAGFFPASANPTPPGPGTVTMRIQAPAGTPAVADPATGDVVLDHGLDMIVQAVRAAGDGGVEMGLTVLSNASSAAGSAPTSAPALPAAPASTGQQQAAPARPAPPPVPDRSRAYHRSLDGVDDLAALVDSPVSERRSLTPGMVGTVERLTHEDGTDEFHKINGEFDGYTPEEVTDAEQLAALVGHAISAPVPRVYRTGPAEIHTDWSEGTVGSQWVDQHGQAALDEIAQTPAARRLGLLDMLVGNSDRHSGNFLITDDGQLTGIDHGFAWSSEHLDPDDPDMIPEDWVALGHLNAQGSAFVGGFVDQSILERSRGSQREAVDMPWISPQDVTEIRGRLEALRPEFEHLGRGQWLDYSLRILDGVGHYATGTGSLLNG
jgi:hypothetical protein